MFLLSGYVCFWHLTSWKSNVKKNQKKNQQSTKTVILFILWHIVRTVLAVRCPGQLYYYISSELPAWISYSAPCHNTEAALILTDSLTRQSSRAAEKTQTSLKTIDFTAEYRHGVFIPVQPSVGFPSEQMWFFLIITSSSSVIYTLISISTHLNPSTITSVCW